MQGNLAVFAEHVAPSNFTYIRRHIDELLPGSTVLVTGGGKCCSKGDWKPQCPTLYLSSIKPNPTISMIADKIGWNVEKDFLKQVASRFLKQHRVRAFMGELLDSSLPWIEIARDAGVRFYGHAHGIDVSANMLDPYWRNEYLKYKEADGIITINQISKARLIELGIEEKKIHVIPCGVDIPDQPIIRTEKDRIRCLAIGRMVSKKAPILTLDAFRRALEVFPALELDYIGEGELLSAVEQYVHTFGLKHKVRLHGGQKHEVVKQYLKDSDIFIQHSRTDPYTGDEEGMPVAILEAMAYSLPVVSTYHAGIQDAVSDGVSGFLVEEGDTKSMSEKIAMLAFDYGLRFRMGNEGVRRARELFSWDNEKNRLLQVMELV